jgi:hypothetical protein
MSTKFIMFHIPQDPETLAAVGEVAIRHEHLNRILRMTIKTLAGITVEQATKATMYAGSGELRSRVKKLARQRLGEGAALLKLEAMLADCERLTAKRNDLIHGLWAKELDGEAHVQDAFGQATRIPSAKELRDLALELGQITVELNYERLEGFLHQALSGAKKAAKG